MARPLTDAEDKAVRRVERAIEALPKTVALYFHGSTATVMDCDERGYLRYDHGGGGLSHDDSLDGIRTPRCEAGDF